MVIFGKREKVEERPFAHNARLLREMPWLWAIRQSWGTSHRMEVIQVDHTSFFDYLISRPQEQKGVCYVYTATDHTEKVHRVEIDGHPRDVYDALTHLRVEKGVNLSYVENIAVVVGDETRVYRPKGGKTFGDLFDSHPRSQCG
jgi:hypothetical protein